MKKILICPTFASSHLLDLWIQNMQETINPDVILIREKLFKTGSEGKTVTDKWFKDRWCYEGTNAGFDWDSTVDICQKYSNVDLNWRNCNEIDPNKAYINSMTDFGLYQPEIGDVIILGEPDAFLLESDSEAIQRDLNGLEPGFGLSIKYVDFLQTQFYTENINVYQPKFRRFAYCFDNLQNYISAIDGFTSQNYPKLRKVEDYFVRHYPWFVNGRFKQLRYELITRSGNYWNDFENGLQEIQRLSEGFKPEYLKQFHDKIVIRPSRTDESRWAKFINIEHPNHIKLHENFVK